jgi:tetratricopeptide (TPR) repeat protein
MAKKKRTTPPPKPKKTRATPKTAPARAAPNARMVLSRLELLLAAYPGMVLEGEEKKTFAEECPDLANTIAAHPRDPEILFRCAWAYRKLGRFDEALDAADLALAVGRTWRAVTAKATVYRAKGDAEGAIALFDEAARIDPADTSALMEGARAFGEAGRFREAADWFARVLERDREHIEARLWREYSWFMDTRAPEHVAAVRALAEANPTELASRLLADMEAR